MASGNVTVVTEKVTQEQLKQKAQEANAIRVGSTVDPKRRATQYSSEGYSGKMFIAETQNMKQAEDRLLQICACRQNVQKSSNADPDPGYVYVLQGKKCSK